MTTPHTTPALEASDPDAAAALLREQGMRVSAARRIVIEALFAADGAVTADQIADGLDGRLPRSDQASVYRNLETLERAGLIRHFHVGHGPGLYALASTAKREYLYCETCGEAQPLEPDALDGVRALIAREHGFTARFDHFPIAGQCRACAAGQD